MAASSRFVEISQELLDDLLDNSIPEKTKRATKYGMKIFDGKFSRCCCFFFSRQNYELFINSKQIQPYSFLDKSFNIWSLFYYRMVCKPNKI